MIGKLTAALIGGSLAASAAAVALALACSGTALERIAAGALVTPVVWVGAMLPALLARSGWIAWQRLALASLALVVAALLVR